MVAYVFALPIDEIEYATDEFEDLDNDPYADNVFIIFVYILQFDFFIRMAMLYL